MRTLSGRKPSQKHDEIMGLIHDIKSTKCQSYLEIGSRDGDTFYDIVTKCMPKDAVCVAIDLPGGKWGNESSESKLRNCIETLRSKGWQNVYAIFGDSTDSDTIKQVKQLSPIYDAMLIDGDHEYDGVNNDWLNYSPIANKLVAFHDIAGEGIFQRKTGHEVQVPRLWNEIKHDYSHKEYISEIEPDRPMGIGVILLTDS